MSLVLSALAKFAKERPDAPALSAPDRPALTFSELATSVVETADRLETLLMGARSDSCVAILMDNSAAWVVTDLALMRLKRPSLPLPPFFTERQREHALRDAGAAALLTDARHGARPNLCVAGHDLSFLALNSCAVGLPAHTAKVTYTSGSTGQPKGVCLSQAHLDAVAQSLVEFIGSDYAGLHVPILPLAVLLENVAGLYANLLAGGCYHAASLATVGFETPFSPNVGQLIGFLAASRATSIIVVPEILRAMLAALSQSGAALPDLKFVAVGGARVSPRLIEAAHAVGLPVYEGYGLTECASVVALNTPGAHRAGRVGKILPHLSVTVAPDGEIVVGPNPFLGYVGATPHSGPCHTGDLGALDDEGFLSVTGRKTNTIVNAFGRNISPEWVEGELAAQPEIAQAFVFGEAKPALGAIITPASPAIDEQRVAQGIARANAGLPEYARIQRWKLAERFTRESGQLTMNGRVRRETLAATYADFVNFDG